MKFKLTVDMLQGTLQLPLITPAITLGGRESKTIVTDYTFGASALTYSTTAIFFAGVVDGRDILFLHGPTSQAHEFALSFTGTPNPWFHNLASPLVAHYAHATAGTVISLLPGIDGLVTIYDSDTQLILFADTGTAATFWAPTLAGADADPFRAFWGIGTTAAVLVGGPYLVRGAALEAGGTRLALSGDLKEGVRLTVVGPRSVRSITWNGMDVGGGDFVGSGMRVVDVGPRVALKGLPVPDLEGWRYADSLPEIREGFDDKSWTTADHTVTNVPEKMWYGDGRVLYGCDYGLYVIVSVLVFCSMVTHGMLFFSSCENVVLWRGHFNATGAERSVNLSINGGEGSPTLHFSFMKP